MRYFLMFMLCLICTTQLACSTGSSTMVMRNPNDLAQGQVALSGALDVAQGFRARGEVGLPGGLDANLNYTKSSSTSKYNRKLTSIGGGLSIGGMNDERRAKKVAIKFGLDYHNKSFRDFETGEDEDLNCIVACDRQDRRIWADGQAHQIQPHLTASLATDRSLTLYTGIAVPVTYTSLTDVRAPSTSDTYAPPRFQGRSSETNTSFHFKVGSSLNFTDFLALQMEVAAQQPFSEYDLVSLHEPTWAANLGLVLTLF